MGDFICHDVEKRGFCTCSASFDVCSCRPIDVSGAPTACADCGTAVFHRQACGDCERFPCACPEGEKVGTALLDALFRGRYAAIQLPPSAVEKA
jgi:hypothetical protein